MGMSDKNIDHNLATILSSLIADWENEVVEFKQVGDNYSTDKIGRYFSALSNEANLRRMKRAWLVFGVNDKSRCVVGTDYRLDSERLQSLKMQISENSEPSITFRNIHELEHPDGRVILCEVPAAPGGMPISWNGHYYARSGESLTALGLDKQDEIRRQTMADDWSAQVVPNATLKDLDSAAVEKARDSFAKKYANRFKEGEVEEWSLETFLDRARLTQSGAITRATLLLLGKAESAYLMSPHPAQMTWKLEGAERAYEHFSLPFLLNTTVLYQRIRNIQLRILPNDELLAVEVSKYDRKVVLEALHNCIAHQDYYRNGRIIVTERLDRLMLVNEGSFFDGQPADYIAGEKTPSRYRNPFLAQAMAELNMIDTMGYGIHDMHVGQAKRYFPLPDYDLTDPGVVQVVIHGKIVDPAYTRLLLQNTGLSLTEVLALDRVQKKLPIENTVAKRLRKAGLIEGRKPNLHIAAKIAAFTDSKAEYIRTRKQDDVFYMKLVVDYVRQYGSATRKDIDKLLFEKLSNVLSDEQKHNKIHNLLGKMKRKNMINNQGSRSDSLWALINEDKLTTESFDLSKKKKPNYM